MNNTELLATISCALVFFAITIVSGIYSTKAKIRYITFINKLKRSGLYAEWSNKNKIVLFSESFFGYACIVSFFGSTIAGILRIESIGKILFVCFIIFCLLAIICSLILYQRVPKE